MVISNHTLRNPFFVEHLKKQIKHEKQQQQRLLDLFVYRDVYNKMSQHWGTHHRGSKTRVLVLSMEGKKNTLGKQITEMQFQICTSAKSSMVGSDGCIPY